MKIEVVGKNGFNPTETNKEYAVKKLQKLDKLVDSTAHARVVCKVYKSYHKVEVTIPAKHIILRAEAQNEELYGAIDLALDKLEKQIKKYNSKVKDKTGKKGIRHQEEIEEQDSRIVRNKQLELVPMTKEEALDQMELLGHDFFVYLDKETKKTNVIYLRDDGDFAIIETEVSK